VAAKLDVILTEPQYPAAGSTAGSTLLARLYAGLAAGPEGRQSRTLAEVKGDAIRQWVEQAAALALARSPKPINNNNNHINNNNELLKGGLAGLAGPGVAVTTGAPPKRQWSPTLQPPGGVPHLPSGPWSRASVSPPATVVPKPETPTMLVAPPRGLDEQPLDFSVPEHVKKNGLHTKHVINNNNNNNSPTSPGVPSYLRQDGGPSGSSSASSSEDEGVGGNTESSAVESSPMAPRGDGK
jgi:hypothetical protein